MIFFHVAHPEKHPETLVFDVPRLLVEVLQARLEKHGWSVHIEEYV